MAEVRAAFPPPAMPAVLGSGVRDRYLCYAILAGLLLGYGEIFRALIYNPLRPNGGVEPFSFLANYIRYAICLGTLIVAMLSGPGALSRPLRIMAPLLPFCLVAAATTLWSADIEVTIRYSILLFGFLYVSGFLIERLGTDRLVGGILHFLAFIVVVSTLVAIALPAMGRHDAGDLGELNHVGRWRGVFSHKNALGAYAALASVLLFTHSHLMGGPRLYVWLARGCALVCLAMSGSSTAIFGTVVLVGTYVLFHRRQVAHPIVLVLGFILALLAYNLLSSDMVAELLGRDATFSGRTLIWNAAIEVWSQSPWGGFGYSAGTPAVLGPFLTQSLFSSAVDAHNAYLDVMVDTGAVGLAALLFGIGIAFLRGYYAILRGTGATRSATVAMMMILASGLAMALGEVSPLRLVSNGGFLVFLASLALAYRDQGSGHPQPTTIREDTHKAALRPGLRGYRSRI
jgi:O-antigen ligase